ncbi:NAD(P)-dependent alcohol dehydrogenase [Alicyclobacillaceae bacterium I2511]|nr:NAD(P)-dependent alcohol dehydrogenase [Alicyclobacillaceae bacterium I2511]
MKALIHQGEKGLAGVRWAEVETPVPGPGEVRVQVVAMGLNHRDLRVLDWHSPSQPAVVLGSDGAGVVDAVGPGVSEWFPGDEVVIDPSLNWLDGPFPPENVAILGFPSNGTFAEYVVVPACQIAAKPSHLQWREAGVLPLAGLTAYRALFTRGQLQAGQTVLLPGIGGGVATILLRMAKAAGAKVAVCSRNVDKLALAKKLGADVTLHNDEDWALALRVAEPVQVGNSAEKVNLIVDSVGPALWDKYWAVLKTGGTLVHFGSTTGNEAVLPLREFFFAHWNLLGTAMGSHAEFLAMLAFVEQHQIKPVIDRTFALSEAPRALSYLAEGVQFGKVALHLD